MLNFSFHLIYSNKMLFPFAIVFLLILADASIYSVNSTDNLVAPQQHYSQSPAIHTQLNDAGTKKRPRVGEYLQESEDTQRRKKVANQNNIKNDTKTSNNEHSVTNNHGDKQISLIQVRTNGQKKHGSGDDQTRGRTGTGTGRRQNRSRERNTDQRRSRSRSGDSARQNQSGRGKSHAGSSSSSVSTNIIKEDDVPQEYSIGISVMRYDGGIVNLIKSDKQLLIENVLRDYYKIESEYVEYGKLNIDGRIVQIKDYLNNLARRDNRWYMPGQVQQRHHLFRPIFDGHIMVPLVNNDGVETARYHFNHYGLNVYIKEMETNFLVEEKGKGDFKYIQLEKDLARGSYEKEFFQPNLLTRKITMKELNSIALRDVINGREYSANGDFMCRHFAYEFVLSIVETNYDRYFTNFYDFGVTAFAKSVQDFYFRQPPPPRH